MGLYDTLLYSRNYFRGLGGKRNEGSYDCSNGIFHERPSTERVLLRDRPVSDQPGSNLGIYAWIKSICFLEAQRRGRNKNTREEELQGPLHSSRFSFCILTPYRRPAQKSLTLILRTYPCIISKDFRISNQKCNKIHAKWFLRYKL